MASWSIPRDGTKKLDTTHRGAEGRVAEASLDRRELLPQLCDCHPPPCRLAHPGTPTPLGQSQVVGVSLRKAVVIAR